MFRKIARTSEHMVVISVPSFLGYIIVLYQFYFNSDINILVAMFYSLSAFFITFLYIYWYSNNNRIKSAIIQNSQTLPEFTLFDNDGKSISSESFIGTQTLLFFHRGNWCPLCMAQIDEIADLYKKFEENNINLVFISPQPEQNTKRLAAKYKLSFNFYTDKNNKVAKQLGLVHMFGLPFGFQALGYDSHSVYPTVIAVDARGVVLYNDQTSNYRLRPEPQELLKVFQ